MRPFSSAAARTLRTLPTFRTSPALQLRRQQFSTTQVQRVRDEGQSAEEVERKKHEQIKKQDKGKGEWHESLASSSESRVKADQEHVRDHDEHIEDLQKETADSAEKEKGKK